MPDSESRYRLRKVKGKMAVMDESDAASTTFCSELMQYIDDDEAESGDEVKAEKEKKKLKTKDSTKDEKTSKKDKRERSEEPPQDARQVVKRRALSKTPAEVAARSPATKAPVESQQKPMLLKGMVAKGQAQTIF